MAANDLQSPLGQEIKSGLRLSKIFMLGSITILTGLVVGLLGWVALVDDPHGGYPSEQIDLSKTLNQTAQIGIDSIRPAIKPGIPETNIPRYQPNLSDNAGETSNNSGSNSGEIRVLDPSDPSLSKPVGQTNRAPYQTFARQINSDAIAGLPKIAIIVDGLGLSQTTTQEALSLLPPDVTLAFAPYGNGLDRWTRKARNQGHELLVQVPMEPFDYPNNDPGPHTLLTSADTSQNTKNLDWVLSRFGDFVGIMNYMGARFTADELVAGDLSRELSRRGLLYVENGASGRSRMNDIATSMQVPNLRANLIIDVRGRTEDIETRLVQLETLAQDRGYALGTATAFPSSIRTIAEWSQSLRQRGFALVPVTTLLQQ